MLVTIIADASWDPETGAGGYGYWSVSQRGRHSAGGALKSLARNNNVAEMMAVVNGVHMAFAHQIAMPGDSLLAQTDCQAAILAFEGKRLLSVDERMIVEGLNRLIDANRADIRFKHVKGHTRGDVPRLWVNNHCDGLAKTGMRQARARVKSGAPLVVIETPQPTKETPEQGVAKQRKRAAANLRNKTNLRKFAFEETGNTNDVDSRVLPIPPWEEQQLPEQSVAGDGVGIPVAA
ncbi:hypothetical protein WS89_03930 [Burkholderia sp. MSMB1072]|uniref:ribonuclease HI n=1 Tax=Burkholderia sp. MSMB1072 TaxID=1637871 RepID=UPI00075BD49B|nr:RNase H family protein [Burkholderia sp. MSMB1072]KVH64440.1 hypothetical protein WS89_03930 [Burkholderia sp. MSMB1072]